jgi:hypothetical protein
MNDIFNLCVKLLEDLARIFGITYEEINVLIFCIIGPVIFIIQILLIIKLKRQIMHLKSTQIK